MHLFYTINSAPTPRTPFIPHNPLTNTPPPLSPPHLQLHLIINQPHLLPRLKRRQSHIRTPIAPKRIPQRTVPTAAHLALHGKVDFGQLVGLEFREGLVGGRAFAGVFGFEALGEAAGAVFAGAAAFSGFGAALGC